MEPALDDLAGYALVNDASTGEGAQEILHYPESALPADVKKRFEVLFAHRTVWALEDITPYLEPVALGGKTVANLLFKHARMFKNPETGGKMYNKR